MTEKNNSKEKPKAQLSAISDKHTYNTDGLDDFLSLVFHTEMDADENILCWMTNSIPGYPIDDDALISKLSRVPIPKALYFGTSTCKPDPRDGKLYNRKSLFGGLYVVVLDDIGTKVPIDLLPAELEPTYIIESSKGNFQYGYVLEEPIKVLEHAEALIQLVYDSGFTDAGGKMPTKLVRLPDGVNGKKGDRGKFHVELRKDDGPLWTPEDLLEILELGVTWDAVLEDAESVIKQRARQHVGLTQWSPVKLENPTLGGLADPVLEWLYARGSVKQETNDWVSIRCPWADDHSDDKEIAGYSPIGRGVEPYTSLRIFHCFHGHCQTNKTGEFLKWVAANGGPEAAIEEHAAELLTRYAYDPVSDVVWDIKSPVLRSYTMQAFKNKHPDSVPVYTMEGKRRLVKESTLWLHAPNRVTVEGQIFDPSQSAPIITDQNGELKVNLFNPPDWGAGPYDQKHVDKFTDYLKYLIPDEESYEFYLDWIAAKSQNFAFRGPAIIMIAGDHGTGRSTLSRMLEQMFGHQNLENVPFDKLTAGGEFNGWLTSPFIVSDETLALGKGDNFYKVFERLKDIVDTTPKIMRINPKYGRQYQQTVYASFMFFSNHQNAMSVPHNDRRFYVLDNPVNAESVEYFEDLHAWLGKTGPDKKPLWAKHVWRWLQEREPDISKLYAPVKINTAKQNMMDSAKTPLHIAVDAMFEELPSFLVPHFQMQELLEPMFPRLGIEDGGSGKNQLRAIMRDSTWALQRKSRVSGRSVRLRVIKSRMSIEEKKTFLAHPDSETSRAYINNAIAKIEKTDLKVVREAVENALMSHDR